MSGREPQTAAGRVLWLVPRSAGTSDGSAARHAVGDSAGDAVGMSGLIAAGDAAGTAAG
jgi:hypothetical protein